MQTLRLTVRRYLGALLTVVLIGTGLPAVIGTNANATSWSTQIGGPSTSGLSGGTPAIATVGASSTATITIKYLRKAGDYGSDFKAWVWCKTKTGTVNWGTGSYKDGGAAATGDCTNGSYVSLNANYDSWGASATFTVTTAASSSLSEMGIIVYSAAGNAGCCGTKDSQSGSDRYFLLTGSNTQAWLTDDGTYIYNGDPKTGYSTYNYASTTTSKFRIHYNRADNNYAGYYANLGWEQGTNNNVDYRNAANKASYQFQKAINFNGTTSSSYGTYSTGSDAFGPYVDFIPSTSWYTGGFTYMDICITTSATDAIGSTCPNTNDGGFRYKAPDFNGAGTQDIYVQSGSGIGQKNPYASKPTVTNTSVTNVASAGGTSVTLTGTNFTPVTGATPYIYVDGTVSVGTGTDSDSIATPAATIAANAGFTSTSLTFTMPAVSTGAHTIYVGTAAGYSAGTSVTAVAAPTITSTPSPSPVRGQTVTVGGTNFDGAGAVWTFAGATVTPSPLSATSATYTIPATATLGNNNLVVTTAGGSATATFNVVKGTPTVSGCTATGVLTGQSLASSTISGCSATVTGTGVTVLGAYAWATPTAVPANGGSYTINFTPTDSVGFNSATSSATVAVVANPPSVTSLVNTTVGSGTEGKVGDTVTITGLNFTGSTGVKFGATTQSVITVVNDTTITTTVPVGVTLGTPLAVQVLNAAGNSNNDKTFTVWAAPSLTSLSATAGKVGDTVTITGTGLKPSSGNPTVSVGGVSASVTGVPTNTSVSFNVPNATQDSLLNVTLTTIGGTSSPLTYTIRGIPTLTAISPTPYATHGATVTLTGTNFLGATKVTFGGTDQNSITVVNATTITAVVPALAPSGVQAVTVTNSAGTTSSVNLNIGDAPTITAPTPVSAPRGSAFTITGTFLTGSTWTFNGSAITPTAVTATTAAFTVPTNATFGAATIVGTTNYGTATSTAFTVLGYAGTVSVKVHYYGPTSNMIHVWIPTPTPTAYSGTFASPAATIAGISPEYTVTSGGTDSYGGIANITITGASNVQSLGFLVWAQSDKTKDTGSTTDRFWAFKSQSSDEFWLRSDVNNVYTSNPFGNTPTITSLSASAGKAGDTLVIKGTNLVATASPAATSNPTVTIGGVTATVAPSPSATAISVTVPAGVPAGSAQDVVVSNAAGQVTQVASFTNNGPSITSLSAASGGRVSTITVTGVNLAGATFTVGGVNAVVSAGATSTSATITVDNTTPFGATNVVATTAGGTASSAFTVTGYTGTVTLTVHYNQQDFKYWNDQIKSLHVWIGTGQGSLNTGQVNKDLQGIQINSLGEDSYGAVAKIISSSSVNLQSICFVIWSSDNISDSSKDVGSKQDRCRTLKSVNDEIWLRNYVADVNDSDPFEGINPNPNRSPLQTVTVHYDGDTAKYPYIYLATRSDLNNPSPNPYTYWINPIYLDLTKTGSVSGPTGSQATLSGSDTFGKYVTVILPYNAAHSTWANMSVCSTNNIVTCVKDGGNASGNRYLALDPSGATDVYLKTGDTTGNAASATNPYSVPVVASLSATSGKSGDVITATGTNLVANVNVLPKVTVGGIVAAVVTTPSPDATAVSFTIPNGLSVGSQAVQITTGGGASNSDKSFTIVGAPTLTSVNPTSGIRGDSITFTGSGFINDATTVKFGAVAASSVTVTNATTLTAVVPATAVNGLHDVSVTTSGGTATLTNGFTVLQPAPTLVAPTASGINVGQTLASSNLSGGSASYNGMNVTGTFAWSTPASTPPPGTAAYAVTFTPTDGTTYATATGTATLTVKDFAPSITSISVGGNNVLSALIGSNLVINGTALSTTSSVTIGGVAATVVSTTATTATVTVSANTPLGADAIVLTTNGGSANSTITINAAMPTITAVTPATQKQNAAVVITGTNFTGLTGVTIDGLTAIISISPSAAPNDTSITVIVPDTAKIGTDTLTVTTASGSVDSTITVTAGTPIITQVSPLVGLRGTTVTVTGKFLTGATATLGDVALTPTITNATTFAFVVPQNVATGALPIVVSVGGQTLNGTFTVVNVPAITSLSKSSGLRGDALTITGTDLSNATALQIGASIATISNNTSTSIDTTVPIDVASGAVKIIVTTAGGASNLFDYTVLDSPTITKLSATSGQRGSKFTVTGTFLTNATFKVAGLSATVDAGATATSATITVPNNAPFGATTVDATTVGGTASSAFTVNGYDSATLTIHYNKQDFGFNNTYIHSWIQTGTGTVAGVSVPGANSTQSPETSVTSLGTDSYGGVAKITYTGSNIQQAGYLVWTLSAGLFNKDTGSAKDRYFTFDTANGEIWIRNYDNTVGTSDLFAGIQPSPNRLASQSVTIHYDGDTATYPKVYIGTRSELNNPSPNPYAYWVNPVYLDFTTPTTVSGPGGTQQTTVGTDTFGKYVTVTLPYNAAHTTYANMVVGNANLDMKDGTDRFAALDASGTTNIWLVAGDSAVHGANTGAYVMNPYSPPVITSLSSTSGKAGDVITAIGTNLVANALFQPTVTVGGVPAIVATSPSPNATAVSFAIPNGLTAGVPSAVSISNAGGSSNIDKTFTLVAAPGSISVSPLSGLKGSVAVITGQNLANASSVTIGGVSAQITLNTDTDIDIKIPQGVNAGAQQITVNTLGGSLSTPFTVLADTPVLTPPTASKIVYGQALSSSTLTGGSALVNGATVTGKFTFTAPNTMPNAGVYNAAVTFTPDDVANYNVANAVVAVTVDKAMPMIVTPPTALPITYGAQLINATLGGGSANVDGTFTYDAPNTSPVAGKYVAAVTFTPKDASNYNSVTGIQVPVTVNKAMPQVIQTPVASAITFGQPLGMSVLSNGLANTSGQFAFANPMLAPAVGVANQDVVFNPTDTNNYNQLTGVKVSVTVNNPAPTVNGVNPQYGVRGTSIIISGMYFDDVSKVTVGAASAQFTFVNSTTITAVVPSDAPSGLQSVSVTTPSGTGTRPGAFAVLDPPTVSSLSPAIGPRGTVMTIAGSNMGTATVTIGGVKVTPSLSSPTSITFTVPDAVASGDQDVVVATFGGSASKKFTVVDAPVVLSINPTSGLRGDTATITGNYLTNATVTVGGVSAIVVVNTATSVAITIPDGVASGAQTVAVTTVGGTASLLYTVLDPPSNISLNPTSGLRGTTVTITGQNLSGGTVTIGEVTVVPSFADDTTITFNVPQAANSGLQKVSVVTAGGTSDANFLVLDAPAINSITPQSAVRGVSVTLAGMYLSSPTLTVDGNAVVPTNATATSITFVVPAAAKSGIVTVSVTTAGGSASTMLNVLDQPQVMMMNPTQGVRGTSVSLSGQYLSNATVTVGGIAVVPSVNTDMAITFNVPMGVASGGQMVVVTTNGGSANRLFTVLDAPVINTIDPSSGLRGTTVTLTGSNLANANVSFNGMSILPQLANETTITFTVPNNAMSGANQIMVMTPGGQTMQSFNVLDVPSIQMVSSTQGLRGSMVMIKGNGLASATVYVGNALANVLDNNQNALTFTIPMDALSGLQTVTVTTAGGKATTQYTVLDAPVITSVTPIQGLRGSTVTVNGTALSDASLLFGGNVLAPINVTDTSVTFTVPQNALSGPQVIQVVTPGGKDTSSFTVLDAPGALTLNTYQGLRGTQIVATGTKLTNANVMMGGVNITPDANTDTTVTFTVPNQVPSGAQTISITTNGGTTTAIFNVLDQPIINAVSPSKIGRGGNVTLAGQYLSNATVTIGGIGVTPMNSNNQSITFTVPAGVMSGTNTINVTTAGGASSAQIQVIDFPVITSISPLSAARRATVTVTGTTLDNLSAVAVGNVMVTPLNATATSFQFVVPDAVISGLQALNVMTIGGMTSKPITILDGPTVYGVNPTAAVRGSSVSIGGRGLSGAAITIDGISVNPTLASDTLVTFVVPAGVASGQVLIVATAGVMTSSTYLTVLDIPGAITLSPQSGPHGTLVTISGKNYAGATVTMGGVAIAPISASDTTITFTVPDAVPNGLATVAVKTSGGTVSQQFMVMDAPVISAISPLAGVRGSTVTITGKYFMSGSITIGGATVMPINVTPTSMTFIVPAAALSGLGTLTMTTAGGTASTAFTVLDYPMITVVNPMAAARGISVTLSGKYLTNATVTIAGIAVVPTVSNDTTITFTVPQNVPNGSAPIVVTTSAGVVNKSFGVLADTPLISGANPTSAKPGGVVTLAGTGLSNSVVTVQGLPASVTLNSATSITFTVPVAAALGASKVVVTNAGGTDSTSINVIPFGPMISAVTPTAGKVGATVTLTGNNLANATSVTVAGTTAFVSNNTATSITFTVPNVAVGGTTVAVTTAGGTDSKSFSVIPDAPGSITMTPSSGTVGATVIAAGSNLGNVSSVTVGGVSAKISANDATSVTFTIPVGVSLGTQTVAVTTSGGTANANFTVLPNAPTITSLSASGGKAGDLITINGTNLATVSDVSFNGASTSLNIVGVVKTDTALTVYVPPTTTGTITVTTAGGTATSGSFTIYGKPTVTLVNPLNAHRGDVVVLTGTNLGGATDVSLGGTSASISLNTDTEVDFTVPNSMAVGATTVVVTTPGGASVGMTLVIVQDAPTISTLSAAGGKVGDVITITGTNFTNVSDVSFSGVSASLAGAVLTPTSIQIAVPANAKTGTITVTTPGGTATSASYTVYGIPSVIALSPLSIRRGSLLTIQGANLAGATAITIGGTNVVNYTVVNATTITATVPLTTPTGNQNVIVTTPGGASVAKQVAVLVDAPTITSFTQSLVTKAGYGTVTVTGTNLTGATVKVGNVAAAIKSGGSATTLTFYLPANAVISQTATFTITTPGGSVTSTPTLKITVS